MALNMNSVGIPGEFRGNAGFSRNILGWGGFGRFGASKGFCANSQPESDLALDHSIAHISVSNGLYLLRERTNPALCF